MKPVLALRHVPHEGVGTIERALLARDVPLTVHDVFAQTPLDFDPDSLSGLIVMGGPMNVDQVDRYPVLAEEPRWIRQAVDADIPVLGVCLGAQLLAKVLGARVYANRIKEIGWYDVDWLPAAGDDRLFHDCLPRSEVFQWHGDTFDLPAGAVQLARSPRCENQAFRYGDSAYGLQFHMEVTSEIIDSWLCESGNCGELAGLDYIDPAAIRRQTPEKLPAMATIGQRVFDRFVQLCAANDGR